MMGDVSFGGREKERSTMTSSSEMDVEKESHSPLSSSESCLSLL